MVAVKNHEADRYIASPPSHVFAFLIFGNDVGLIRERARLLFRRLSSGQDDAFSTVRLSGDDIAADASLLADEAYSIGLFGGKRAIWIESGAKNFIPRLEVLFNDPPRDSVIIVEAGVMRRDAPLRVLFERANAAVAIECYPDSEEDLLRLIDQEAKAAELTISEEVRHELVSHLGSDRAATRAEIEKLMLYSRGARAITSRDIEAIVADASALALDAAIASAFMGEQAQVTETAERAFETGNDPGVVLGFALRHAVSLHRLKLGLTGGGSMEAAVGALTRGNRNPVLRKRAIRQLETWSPARVMRAIDGISEAVRRCRREPHLDEIIAVRAMWSVALAATGKD